MYDLKGDCFRKLLVGIDKTVFISGGCEIIPINFDNAATTPVFKEVLEKIASHCECYGSIGRGLGQKSEKCTKIYNESKDFILDFFNASKEKYTVILTNNTTDGINRLSNILLESKDDIVIITRMEHHSNDLPWRGKCKLEYLEVDENGRVKIDELKILMEKYCGRVKYLSITAASNVTGYVNDINKIAKLVHKYGCKIIVDGAQIVAHKKINISGEAIDEAIDFFVFSAHKMYAPFGTGVIIGLRDTFDSMDTDLKGGGTVEAVFDYNEIMLKSPEKNEAGSPNFFGVIALVEAMKQLEKIGFSNIDKHEQILLKRTIDGLENIEKVILYGDNKRISDRLGIVVFNIKDIYNEQVARSLAEISAIAVRHGAFCAHPYVKRLLKISDEEASKYITNSNYKMPGMVRASFGIYNTIEEVDRFLNTVEEISKLI